MIWLAPYKMNADYNFLLKHYVFIIFHSYKIRETCRLPLRMHDTNPSKHEQ